MIVCSVKYFNSLLFDVESLLLIKNSSYKFFNDISWNDMIKSR